MRKLAYLFSLLAWAAVAETRYAVIVSIDGGAAYHLDDSTVELPNIRALAADGVRAASSETVFPSVTHPSHTTIITGMMPRKHGVLANELANRASNDLLPGNSLKRSEIILSKTIFDTAKAKGLTTAAFQWPETVEDPSIDFNLISRAGPAGARGVVQNRFVEELEKDGLPLDQLVKWRRDRILPSVGDEITTLAACQTIRKHRPNLVAVHLLETDDAQHGNGPQHYLAKAALSDVDHEIGQIVRATKDAGVYDQTVFVICADHGFTSVYDEINLRPFFAEAGLESKVHFYEGGWAPFIRLLPSFDATGDQPKLEQVFSRLMRNMHIVRILKSADYPSIGLPTWEESDRVRGQYLIIGDAETYFVWTPDNDTSLRKRLHPAHGHGYVPSYWKMYPMLVLAGSGIKKGQTIGHVHNVDIAPTITELLGLDRLDFDGRVLTEALAR